MPRPEQQMRRFAYLAALLVLCLLVLIPRFAQFGRDTWQDEIRHLYSCVNSLTIRDLLRDLSFQMQPALDYLLRKLFWLPLIGQEERSGRLVSMAYGLAAVIACFHFVLKYLAAKSIPWKVATIIAFITAFSFGSTPMANYYAIEARHYALVQLLSTLWFSSYFLRQRFGTKEFFFLSLLFASAHFFALILIFIVSIYEFFRVVWQKQPKSHLIYPALFGIGTFLVTLIINRYAFSAMLNTAANATSTISLLATYSTFIRFWTQDLQATTILFLLVLLLPLGIFRKKEKQTLVFIFAVPILFLLLLALTFRTSEPIHERYLFFYWGIFPVAVSFIAITIYEVLERIIRHWRLPPVKEFVLVLMFLPLFNISSARAIPDAFTRIEFPRRSFTDLFMLYETIKQEKSPVFILYSENFSHEISQYYMRHVISRFEHGFQALDTKSGNGKSDLHDWKKIEQWIYHNPRGIFFLELRTQTGCPEFLNASLSQQIRMTSHGARCLWRLEGVQSATMLIQIMNQLNFPMSTGFQQIGNSLR